MKIQHLAISEDRIEKKLASYHASRFYGCQTVGAVEETEEEEEVKQKEEIHGNRRMFSAGGGGTKKYHHQHRRPSRTKHKTFIKYS